MILCAVSNKCDGICAERYGDSCPAQYRKVNVEKGHLLIMDKTKTMIEKAVKKVGKMRELK
jgi:hypothetical protein